MSIDTDKDLEQLKRIGRIVALTLQTMLDQVKPGITTAELDHIGGKMLAKHGARSAPKITYDFPGHTCISINDEVAHGIPKADRVIRAGDLVNIDVSAELNGYFADSGASIPVPPTPQLFTKLCRSTRSALKAGMKAARAGQPLNRIGKAISKEAYRAGFGVIHNLCSHGVGRALHEEPEYIPSYYDSRDKRTLHEGQVITIEPFLTNGPPMAFQDRDGWTLRTQEGCFAAQYEHTIVITKRQPIVITRA
ncbi:type I methionyl aminopeptidase [Sulfidibacter corallicola]|uniref:Methionine aminopeptidase n=1 Tax=Sulfidibacter corallicola TaxID=2818388 RepID=A0A8A4TN41_SULCO|nr:type I methionyl aminopeptidase [Sulfidibacter corallicola]QTD50960.1 type I methionyl aminopeptidase [Sulfidibacter corallicola]